MQKVIEATIKKAAPSFVLIGLLILAYKFIIVGNFILPLAIIAGMFAIVGAIVILPKPRPFFTFVFILNYYIYAIQRYYVSGIKVGITMLALIILGFILTILYNWLNKVSYKNLNNLMIYAYLLLLAEYILHLFRATGVLKPWTIWTLVIVFMPLASAFFTQVFFPKEKYLRYMLIIWGILSVTGAIKGWYQRSIGFNSAELAWLWGGAYRTHFLITGVRYFSFFTDAANFGTSMAMTAVTYGICFLYEKKVLIRLFYLGVFLSGVYGLLISGTRSAFAVPGAAAIVFIICSKNAKLMVVSLLLLIGSYSFLKYTNIGEENRFISRTRTIVNYDKDASFQVRMINQRALRKIMVDYPFGVGVGLSSSRSLEYGFKFPTAPYATDSWFVMIWQDTGIVGLYYYLGIIAIVLIGGINIVLYKIRDPEVRGYMVAMVCLFAGAMAGGYSNEVLSYPNGMLCYTCLAYVYIATVIDKEVLERKRRNEAFKYFGLSWKLGNLEIL